MDPIRKEFVLKKVVQYVHPDLKDMVLQIGADEGILFRLIHRKVKECHCVEQNGRRAKVMARRYRGVPNILVQHSSLTNLPYPQSYFTKIFFHELSFQVSSELELRRVLDEISRVAAAHAVVFVGGICTRKEPRRGAWYTLHENVLRFLTRWKARLTPQGELSKRVETVERLLNTRSHGLILSEHTFRSLCREYGLEPTPSRIELTHALSLARTDFLLTPAHEGRKGEEEIPREELLKEAKS